MKKEEMLSLFTLAGIPVLKHWELANGYWPDSYIEIRAAHPWWLVRTPFGLVQIGWRKRVIEIDWSDTEIKAIITLHDVTKSETMVHAWGVENALQYLTALGTAGMKNSTSRDLEVDQS